MWFQKDYASLHHDSNAAITNTAEPAEHKTGKDTMNTATNLTDLVSLTKATFPGFGITEIFQNTNGELHTTSEYDLTDAVTDFIKSQLRIDTFAQDTIVAFHIGRGGHFHNAGFLSFIGEAKIGDYTSDLFINYENQGDVFRAIKGRENLEAKFYECLDNDNFSFFEKLGFDLGEKIYTDCNGSSTGLTVAEEETGIGCINIDNDYDTTYTCKLSDCDDKELQKILDYNGWVSSEITDFAKYVLGCEDDNDEETED